MKKSRMWFYVLNLGLAFLIGCAPKATFHSIDISGAGYGNAFALTDQYGHQRTLADFKGKVVAIFFGYTQCPDVCPTTLSEFVQIKSDLGAQGDRLQVAFVSVDPDRDTPEMLKAYMNNFDESFLAFSPTAQELKQIASVFKIYYEKVPISQGDSKNYTMNHSAGTFLFDTQGHAKLFSNFGQPQKNLEEDIQKLLLM
jgi:protein SCO1